MVKGFFPTDHTPWLQILKRMQIDDGTKSHKSNIFISKIFTVCKHHWQMNLRICCAGNFTEINFYGNY